MSTQSPSIGVIILGRKRPGFDQEWNRIICQRSVSAIESLGFTCVGQDMPVIDDESLRLALKHIRERGPVALVMLQPSMGNGQLALSLAQLWPEPIVLWATPERPEDGKVSSCSLVGQHLWASMLRQAAHPFELVYGDPGDPALGQDLLRAIRLSRTVAHLRRAKLGVVGTYAPGFVDLAVDPFFLQRSLGVELHALSLPRFIDRVNGISDAAAREDVSKVKQLGLPMVDVKEQDLTMNSRCYLAMLEIMKEESLDGLALQCWPEIPEVLGQWPYLAISRLTAEGHAVSMEGDADGAIALLMGASLELGNAFLTDWLEHDQSTIFLWHPGMAPLDMCNPVGSSRGPALGLHFNIVKPLVVDGELQTDKPVTVMRLWHCDNEYRMTAFEGKTIAPRRKITGNTILVDLGKRDVPQLFDTLIHEGMPHHVLLYYGHCGEVFRRLARLSAIRWSA